MESILSIRHLTKAYAAHRAVDDISFDIQRGSIFGLLGPNGAGKTTLLRMITGIFYPDEGEVLFHGKPFNPLKDISKIGYMPEERGLYKKMQIGEQLIYLGQLKEMSLAHARERARFWIDRFDLHQWWNKKVGDLSKGMQQKVQFISTIMHEPELLILDEPFSGLDPLNSNLIKEEIFEMSRKGTTIIFSTHRMEQVEEICKHLVLVNQGVKILDGEIGHIKATFKKHEFRVTLEPEPVGLDRENPVFVVESRKEHTLVIKLKEGRTNNEALSYLMEKGYLICAFEEILPSINEVFITQVERSSRKTSPLPAV